MEEWRGFFFKDSVLDADRRVGCVVCIFTGLIVCVEFVLDDSGLLMTFALDGPAVLLSLFIVR